MIDHDSSIKKFFDFVDQLNDVSPDSLHFVTQIEGHDIRQCVRIIFHGVFVGNFYIPLKPTERQSFYHNYGAQFSVNLDSNDSYSYKSRSDKKGWNIHTKGIVNKILDLTEDLIESSAESLARKYNDKTWQSQTMTDLSTLLGQPVRTMSASKTKHYFDNSGVTFEANIPNQMERKIYPRVYRFRSNGSWLLGGKPVPISDPTLKKVVRKMKKFEKDISAITLQKEEVK